jgi:hypothetical protein
MQDKDQEKARAQAREHAVAAVVEQFKQGIPRESIIERLTQNGVEPDAARNFVDSIQTQLLAEVEKETISGASLFVAMAAAAVAAIIGGAIWGGIVILTDYEIGFMATGIGALSGYAVMFFTEKKGRPLQIIAVASSLLGIFVGKYISFYAILKDLIRIDLGDAAASQVNILSGDVISLFFSAFGELLSPYDLLWIVLAIAAAWSIPRAVGAKAMKLASG